MGLTPPQGPQRVDGVVEAPSPLPEGDAAEGELVGQKPGAATSTKRPSVITSSVAACLATLTTSRMGSTAALSPMRAGSRAPANQASWAKGSSEPDQPGKSGLASRPSPSHSVSMPPSMAARARRTAPARLVANGETPKRR